MRRRTLLAAGAGAALARPARAQASFPERPVRLFIPFVAGGPADLLGRIFAEALGARLGQPVVPESRPGQGGVAALEATARAAPDGHTLVLPSTGGVAISPALPARMPLDVLADLWHITIVAKVPGRSARGCCPPWQTRCATLFWRANTRAWRRWPRP